MRILIQECLRGEVAIDGKIISQIGKGEVIFVGFTQGDDERLCDWMLEKMLKLRIFMDANGKTNLSLDQVGGTVLCVSQFTLYADLSEGNRPAFVHALGGALSEPLYDYFSKRLSERIPSAQYGRFGADMKVTLTNDGPFTILLDSKELGK
jgi:D-tyrosyl-tRNA(Tyr) deacylase